MKRYLLEVDDRATAELNEKSFTLNGQPAFGLRVLANEISMEVLPTDKPITQEDLAGARKMGQKEAWELARKIMMTVDEGGYSCNDLREIFEKTDYGYSMCAQIINENTYEEAIQKVQAWEEEKKAIHVGDIVLDATDDKSGVVLRVGDIYCAILYADGTMGYYKKIVDLKKTGKTVDVSAMLDQIKEA